MRLATPLKCNVEIKILDGNGERCEFILALRFPASWQCNAFSSRQRPREVAKKVSTCLPQVLCS